MSVTAFEAQPRTWRFRCPCPAELATANARIHWAERARRVKELRAGVAVVATAERKRAGMPPNRDRPMRVTLTLVRGWQGTRRWQRLMDGDNAVAAMKGARDGLIDAGWLVDDSSRWLAAYEVRQRQSAGFPRIEVEIAEA